MQYFVFLFAGVVYSMYREYILKPHEAQKALEQKALEKKWKEMCSIPAISLIPHVKVSLCIYC